MKIFRNIVITTAVFALFSGSAVHALDNVSAHSAILIEQSTGDVLFEKNAHQCLPMASTTKIMTALAAIESCDLSAVVTVPDSACGAEGSSIYLQSGDRLTMESLLYALMLESANDAAEAIAYAVDGSIEAFAAHMNLIAETLGLHDTNFTNPHGLDHEQHYTTAYDLALLTAHALKNETFARIVSTKQHNISLTHADGETVTRCLNNHNKLLRLSDDVTGVKTGFTKRSGRCLVSSAERDGVHVICVTLNSPDDWNDHLAMHELGFASRVRYLLAEPGEFTVQLSSPHAKDGVITAANRDMLSFIDVPGLAITHVVEADRILIPPVHEGQRVGRVVFYADGSEIGEIPLYSCESCADPEQNKSSAQKFFDLFR